MENLGDSGTSSKAMEIENGDHTAHPYYKILMVLRLILMKILRLLFLQAFLIHFLSTYSEVVGSGHLGFELES